MDSTATTPRTAYGRRGTIVAVQALVPDEPVEAAVLVARPWTMATSVLAAVACVQVADLGAMRSLGAARLVVAFGLVLALVVGTALLRDRRSALRLGIGNATVAVTPTRVLVLAGSALTGRPRRIVLELDRSTLPVAPMETALGLRSIGVRLPSGSIVALRVLGGRRLTAQAALPLVASPPGASWEPDPSTPGMARLRVAGSWAATTMYAGNLELVRVDVPASAATTA